MTTNPARLLVGALLALLLVATSCGADADVRPVTAAAEPSPAPTPMPAPTPSATATTAPDAMPTPTTSGIDEELPDVWTELHASELAWVRSSILDYEYTFHESCLCPDDIRAPRRIRIEGGRVVSVTIGGEPSDQSGYTVDDLYRQARVALFQNKEIGIDFAPNGVPTNGVIDVEAAAVVGGFIFDITDFEILTEGAPVDDDYLTALIAWRNARIGTYFLGYSPTCFCRPLELDVTVTDGQMTNVVAAQIDTEESTEHPASDVDDMFVQLRNAMLADPHEISVDYHPTEGRPLSFFIDVDATIADEEWGIEVFAFEHGASSDYAEFCDAFAALTAIDDTPETSDEARENLDMMLVRVEAIVSTVPDGLEDSVAELRTFIETVYRLAEEADWEPAFFETLDDQVFVSAGLDRYLLEELFDVVDTKCEP